MGNPNKLIIVDKVYRCTDGTETRDHTEAEIIQGELDFKAAYGNRIPMLYASSGDIGQTIGVRDQDLIDWIRENAKEIMELLQAGDDVNEGDYDGQQ